MTPAQLKQARSDLGLSLSRLANALGVDARTVQRWEAGDRKIPGPVAVLIGAFTAARDESATPYLLARLL